MKSKFFLLCLGLCLFRTSIIPAVSDCGVGGTPSTSLQETIWRPQDGNAIGISTYELIEKDKYPINILATIFVSCDLKASPSGRGYDFSYKVTLKNTSLKYKVRLDGFFIYRGKTVSEVMGVAGIPKELDPDKEAIVNGNFSMNDDFNILTDTGKSNQYNLKFKPFGVATKVDEKSREAGYDITGKWMMEEVYKGEKGFTQLVERTFDGSVTQGRAYIQAEYIIVDGMKCNVFGRNDNIENKRSHTYQYSNGPGEPYTYKYSVSGENISFTVESVSAYKGEGKFVSNNEIRGVIRSGTDIVFTWSGKRSGIK